MSASRLRIAIAGAVAQITAPRIRLGEMTIATIERPAPLTLEVCTCAECRRLAEQDVANGRSAGVQYKLPIWGSRGEPRFTIR